MKFRIATNDVGKIFVQELRKSAGDGLWRWMNVLGIKSDNLRHGFFFDSIEDAEAALLEYINPAVDLKCFAGESDSIVAAEHYQLKLLNTTQLALMDEIDNTP